MSKPVRIGFVGVGTMGQAAHLRNYATLPGCEVVALAEVRPGLAKKVAERYGVPRVYANHEEMLAKEKLDGIVASQPFTRHGILTPELLKAKIPVFTEKPIAGSIEAAEKVIAAMERSGTWLMIGYHKRSDPATMYAKSEIDRLKKSGEIGKLRYARITMPPGNWIANGFSQLISSDEPFPPLAEDAPASDMDQKTYADFIGFVNYYIHQINLLRHLLGERYTLTFVDPNSIVLVATTPSGVTGVIEMDPYRTTEDWQESALVCFERGYVKIELPPPLVLNRAGRVEILLDPGPAPTPEKPRTGPPPHVIAPHLPCVHAMAQQAANFVRAIRGEAPPMCDAHEALEDLRVAREYIRLLTGGRAPM